MSQARVSQVETGLNRINSKLILAGVFLIAYAVYVLSPVTTSTDSRWTFHVAASIIQEGNINLDEYRHLIDLQSDYRFRVIDNHLYSYYPVANPLLVVPFVWIANEIFPIRYKTDFFTYLSQHAPNDRTAKMEKLLASAFAALCTVLMYLIARQYLSILKSLLVAFIFAFSSSMWSTASRALWQHGPSALLLLLALYLVILGRQKESLIKWIGLILGVSYLIRPTNGLSVAFFGLYVFINHRKYILAYILGVAAVLIPYMIHSWLTYQNIFPPYSYQLFERMATIRGFLEALAGTLVSPGRGLFIFSSIFLFSIYGVVLQAGRGKLSVHAIDIYLVGILLAHWVLTSSFEDWSGGWSIGPRYFADVIPYLTYFLIPVLEPGTTLLTKPSWKYSFLATIVVSTLIQLHCSTSIYPFMWNGKPTALIEAPQRNWDWGDLQFLRGFCKEDPLEGRAPACWISKDD